MNNELLNREMLREIPQERLEQYLQAVQEQIGRLAVFQNDIIAVMQEQEHERE